MEPKKTWGERYNAAWDWVMKRWGRIAFALGVLAAISTTATAWDNITIRFGSYAPATRGWVVIHVNDLRSLQETMRAEQIRVRITNAASEIERLDAEQTSINVKLKEPKNTPAQIDLLSKRLVEIGVARGNAQQRRTRALDDCNKIPVCKDEID